MVSTISSFCTNSILGWYSYPHTKILLPQEYYKLYIICLAALLFFPWICDSLNIRFCKLTKCLNGVTCFLCSRQALGLPLEEPGRYVDANYFGNRYDPTNPLYRYDYWGEPKNSEKSRHQRMIDTHNSSIVGKGNVWYETSYEDFIKQKMRREALSKGVNN